MTPQEYELQELRNYYNEVRGMKNGRRARAVKQNNWEAKHE